MLSWSLEHRVFVYDTYVKNVESVIKNLMFLQEKIQNPCHDNVPNRNTILRWINALRTTGLLLKTKPLGPARTVRTPGNVD